MAPVTSRLAPHDTEAMSRGEQLGIHVVGIWVSVLPATGRLVSWEHAVCGIPPAILDLQLLGLGYRARVRGHVSEPQTGQGWLWPWVMPLHSPARGPRPVMGSHEVPIPFPDREWYGATP